MSYYDLVREQACCLYDILEHGWACSCAKPHDVNLQLNQTEVNGEAPSFKVWISFFPLSGGRDQEDQRRWQQTEIRVEKTKLALRSAAKTQVVAISKGGKVKPSKSVRFLEDAIQKTGGQRGERKRLVPSGTFHPYLILLAKS
jgi:hypothetical protein